MSQNYILLDGKKTAQKILNELKEKIMQEEKKPSLAVILANDNPASEIYVSKKAQIAAEVNIKSSVFRFNSNAKFEEIKSLIEKLNNDKNVNAILLQLPLFKHLKDKEDELIELIDAKKDVDGFNSKNLGKLLKGLEPEAVPCTPKGILRLLKEYDIELEGKNALIIGRSNIVGLPLLHLLLKENATVTIAHSKTKNLKEITKDKDIIIAAVGKKNLITKDMVKKGAIIIDVGISRDENGKITGDCDFEGVSELASHITPVPKGVGPMTVMELMENTYQLFLNQKT